MTIFRDPIKLNKILIYIFNTLWMGSALTLILGVVFATASSVESDTWTYVEYMFISGLSGWFAAGIVCLIGLANSYRI